MKERTAEKIMEKTKERIRDKRFQREYTVNPERDFIRKRKLGFSEMMAYILGNCRENMELNAEKFAEAAKAGKMSF